MQGELPILATYDPDKAAKIDASEDGLFWVVKVDGALVHDDHEGAPFRFPADLPPADLVEAVCPRDGLEHRIEAILKGGAKAAFRAVVQLGAHRRMPPTGPAPAAAMGADPTPAWQPHNWGLTPPTSAWDSVIGLARDGQAAQAQAQAKEREVHVHLMAQLQQAQQQMFTQQMAMFGGAMQSIERGLAHVAGALKQNAEAAPAPAAPNLLELLATYGPMALGFGKQALEWLGIEGGDLKSMVGGAIAAKGADPIKAALAENLGAGLLMLMEGGSEWIKSKASVPKRVAQAGRRMVDAAAGAAEAVEEAADALAGQAA